MNMNSVYNEITNTIGREFGKNYRDSASCFNAKIETSTKQRYFIESTQFVSSRFERLPREYHLKCISDSSINKVMTFKNRNQAMTFFKDIEFLPSGALVVERYLLNAVQFYAKMNYGGYQSLYDNGLTACFYRWHQNRLMSFCEGDVVNIHCSTDAIFEAEKAAHLNYFKEC